MALLHSCVEALADRREGEGDGTGLPVVSRLLLCSSPFVLLLEGLLIDGLLAVSLTPCSLCFSNRCARGVSKSSSEDAALVDLLGVEAPETCPLGDACASSSSR